MTTALVLTFLDLDLSKGYPLAQSFLRPYLPSLARLSHFLRTLRKASHLPAHLALALAQRPSHVHAVELKPIPLAHGHRIRGYDLPGSGEGVGPCAGSRGFRWVQGVVTPP